MSLIELLVVISVIAIIAAIGISQFQGYMDGAAEVKARRNAQTIAFVSSAAQSSGNVSLSDAESLDDAISLVLDGSLSGMGTFADMEFSVSDLDEADVEGAKAYLDFVDGAVVYRTGGGAIEAALDPMLGPMPE